MVSTGCHERNNCGCFYAVKEKDGKRKSRDRDGQMVCDGKMQPGFRRDGMSSGRKSVVLQICVEIVKQSDSLNNQLAHQGNERLIRNGKCWGQI